MIRERPPEATLARIGMWVGVFMIVATRIMHPRDEVAWFVGGIGLIVLGLLILPKHPHRYDDLQEKPVRRMMPGEPPWAQDE